MKKKIMFLIIILISLSACTTPDINNNTTTISEKPCTKEYVPVCCEGVTYPNQCYADNSNAQNCKNDLCPEEECVPNDNLCTEEYNPYCCDGIQYSNYCFANNACATNCIKGECDLKKGSIDSECNPNGLACTMQYDPVCCDGKTYSNACVAGISCGENCVDGECE